MRHVVFFSAGAASWAAAKRVVAAHGADNVTLLFTDTLIEDADAYRFLVQGAANIMGVDLPTQFIPTPEQIPSLDDGAARALYLRGLAAETMQMVPGLAWIMDGRNPWEVFADEQILGNSRIDPCSRVLKREPAEKWLKENCDPADTTLVFGLGWDEYHRFDADPLPNDEKQERRGVKNRYARLGWQNVTAPMTEAPYLTKREVFRMMRAEGIEPPRLYDLGFQHNNCGGGCVKAGKGHFAHLWATLPEVYGYWQRGEDGFNAGRPGKRRQTILRDEAKGRPTKPISMADLRKRILAGGQIDMFEIGGCGCFYSE